VFTKKKRKVRVHLKDGPTIEGLLIKRRPVYLIYAPKAITETDGRPAELIGHVEIERENVAFYQVLAQ
jgi:ribosomal protein S16